MYETSEQSRPEWTVMTGKHPGMHVWMYFGVHAVAGKVMSLTFQCPDQRRQ